MRKKKIMSKTVKEILFKMQVAKTNESSLLDVEDEWGANPNKLVFVIKHKPL